MPNGKPGDHWYTDITSHGMPTFSPEIDSLIVELDRRAAGDRPYTPWDDAQRQTVERVVDEFLERIGYDSLAARSETVVMEYRNLTPAELTELRAKLEALAHEA